MDAVQELGNSLSDWRDGFVRRRIPLIEAKALVPEGSRAVVLAPHPDDEVLGTGGLLATWAARGRSIPVLPASALAHWLGPFEHVLVSEGER